jgi:hypothetical protein
MPGGGTGNSAILAVRRLVAGQDRAMTEYTEQEKRTMRTGVFGAVALVSNAEPGMLDMFKEGIAGVKALNATSPELRDVLKGGIPQFPKSPSELESAVLNDLAQSTRILQEKSPAELDGFRDLVVSACDKAAAAGGGGVQGSEAAEIGKVKQALGMS